MSKIIEDTYEQAIIEKLQELDYEYLCGYDVVRKSNNASDVFLEDVLYDSLRKINKDVPEAAINELISKIKNVNEGDLISRNIIFTDYLQSGVPVKYFDGKENRTDILKLIDYKNPLNNTFYVVNQWTFHEYETKRPDIVIFVNGMPLVLFELKTPAKEKVDTEDAYKQVRNYLQVIPSFFVPNVFVVLSDLADTKVGTITAPEDRFVHWKTVDGSYEENRADYKTMIKGMCAKERLLDIIQNFICFNIEQKNTFKILSGYHQYFAVHKAIERTIKAEKTDGKAGVFWHSQGSGKSLSMVFYSHLLQSCMDAPTIVVITDRNDLDDQLYGQFSKCSKFIRQTPIKAESRAHLKSLLENRKAGGIIFSTIQKFLESGETLSDRRNIVVMADEAHRSQYGIEKRIDANTGKIKYGAAGWLRKSLPHASFIGFTGTPIEEKDKNTKEIFGDYIDIYDMTQAVEDGATKPVYYESRVVTLKLDERKLNELDALYEEEAKVSNVYSIDQSKHDQATLDAILGADETIHSLCVDIVHHYEKNRANLLSGKALIVAYSRNCAIKIYKKLLELREEWTNKIAVVMTGNNQDPEEWHEIVGTDARRKELATQFKDENSELKIAIVVDMWLTGFDVPSLSTMYIFKPMRGHNLMQAIARVNRVCRDKEGGLVVDYIGIATALKRAMSDYTKRDRKRFGDMDVAKTAYPEFQNRMSACRDYLHLFPYMETLKGGKSSEIMDAILDAADMLLDKDKEKDRDDFIKQCKLMEQAFSLCKSLTSDNEQLESSYFSSVKATVLKQIFVPWKKDNDQKRRPMSLAELNKRIAEIVGNSVRSEGVINLFDDRTIEFSLFDENFLKEVAGMKQKNIAIEALKRVIAGKISAFRRESVVSSEKFSEMLQKCVNSYLNGMITSAEVIEEMLKLSKAMIQNQSELEKLGLNKDEIAFYEALCKPENIKDFYENEELIALTRELTDSLRRNNTVDWTKKESARAKMRMLIKRLLKKYKYPPEEEQDAINTVMQQCELWSDNHVPEEANNG